MNKHGSKWITPVKRLAIYIRDGLSCAYCGKGVEDEVSLTLDHLKPRIRGGSNKAHNLITSCFNCNSSRNTKNLVDFCIKLCIETGEMPDAVRSRIRKLSRRSLKKPLKIARALLSDRLPVVEAAKKHHEQRKQKAADCGQ